MKSEGSFVGISARTIHRFTCSAGAFGVLAFQMAFFLIYGVQPTWADAILWSDDFSTDTTPSYNAAYWPYAGGSATPSIVYDAPNQRAIIQGVGGYGNIVVEKNGESPIPPGIDFTFSADLSILSEFTGYLYLGDNRPIPPIGPTGTGLRFNIGSYQEDNSYLVVFQNGASVTSLRTTYTSQGSNTLRITRVNGEYSFYLNNTLIWQQAVPVLDGMPLYWGVGNEISSGPCCITAQTAVDNILVILAERDSDGDGVSDDLDQCPNTPPGAIVDADGCSIDQLVPCEGPGSGGAWRNHGQYVSSIAHAADQFLQAGLITQAQKGAIVGQAAQSDCGK